MIDLAVIDGYTKEFEGLEQTVAERHESEKNLEYPDALLLKRFLDGYLERERVLLSNTIYLFPSDTTVKQVGLDICKEGIEEHFLNQAGLNFTVSIQKSHPLVEFWRRAQTITTKRGNEISDYTRDPSKLTCPPNDPLASPYIAVLSNADFFRGSENGTYGRSGEGCQNGKMTFLDRPLWKENAYAGKSERIDHMKKVAAKTAYHAIGYMQNRAHDSGHCLGYQDPTHPPGLCEPCKDSIMALWLGVQARTGTPYVRSSKVDAPS